MTLINRIVTNITTPSMKHTNEHSHPDKKSDHKNDKYGLDTNRPGANPANPHKK